MTASLWAKTVTKAFEVFFVDTFQDGARGLLDDFVLQSCNAKWSFPAVRLGNIRPLGRLSPVCSAMDSVMQIVDPVFQVHCVVLPRLAINPRCCLPLKIEEAARQEFRCDVV
jgi:hypothetical protein